MWGWLQSTPHPWTLGRSCNWSSSICNLSFLNCKTLKVLGLKQGKHPKLHAVKDVSYPTICQLDLPIQILLLMRSLLLIRFSLLWRSKRLGSCGRKLVRLWFLIPRGSAISTEARFKVKLRLSLHPQLARQKMHFLKVTFILLKRTVRGINMAFQMGFKRWWYAEGTTSCLWIYGLPSSKSYEVRSWWHGRNEALPPKPDT